MQADLMSGWVRSQARWFRYHLAQEGIFFLCFFGVLSLWMYVLQDLLHHKIGLLSAGVYEKFSLGCLFLAFGFHAGFLVRCTQLLNGDAWWEFHDSIGGNPAESRTAKRILLGFLYGGSTLVVIGLCARLFVSRSIFQWGLLGGGTMTLGALLARWIHCSQAISVLPPKLPSSPQGALVWSLVRPIFLPHASRKMVCWLLLGALGNAYWIYCHVPEFVCVLYTFSVSLLLVARLTQQVSRNFAYHGWESQHGISPSLYQQGLYLCTAGLGLVGGLACAFGWWVATGCKMEGVGFVVTLVGVYMAPLWMFATCWLQLDPHRPSLPFLISLVAGFFFASGIYATPLVWLVFPLLFQIKNQRL